MMLHRNLSLLILIGAAHSTCLRAQSDGPRLGENVPGRSNTSDLSVTMALAKAPSADVTRAGDSLPDVPSATDREPRSQMSSYSSNDGTSNPPQESGQPAPANIFVQPRIGKGSLSFYEKFRYFAQEEISPGTLIGPAFGAAFAMASPKGKGSTRYPGEWRQGAAAFGRNYGDDLAQTATKKTATFLVGAILREDPRYFRSTNTNYLRRAFDAALFAVIDRSDSGKKRLAISNFAGAAAGGFVGNAYLPRGFRSAAHAEQRTITSLASFAGVNVLHEFNPEIKAVLKKAHVPFVK